MNVMKYESFCLICSDTNIVLPYKLEGLNEMVSLCIQIYVTEYWRVWRLQSIVKKNSVSKPASLNLMNIDMVWLKLNNLRAIFDISEEENTKLQLKCDFLVSISKFQTATFINLLKENYMKNFCFLFLLHYQ